MKANLRKIDASGKYAQLLRKNFHLFLLVIMLFIFLPKVYADTTNVMILLDASGSMAEQIQGVRKIDIAKRTLEKVLRTIPPNARIGLRIYGHQSPRYKRDCFDTKLEVPLAFNNRQTIANRLQTIIPQGYTPLAYSLSQMKSDFSSEGKNCIICITDGVETCDGNPCAIADSLHRYGLKVVIHVIGFRVGEADRDILMCIPNRGGGHYFSADNVKELEEAMQKAMEVSITPGLLKLEFKEIENIEDAISASLVSKGLIRILGRVNTDEFMAVPPGEYSLANFRLYSLRDPDPYNESTVVIDSVIVHAEQETIVPLDKLSILEVETVFDEGVHSAELSFESDVLTNLKSEKITANRRVFLLRQGPYILRCVSKVSGQTKVIEKEVLLFGQNYHKVEFDFTPFHFPYWIFLIVLGVGALAILKIPLKRNDKNTLEEFNRHPERFRGQVVTLLLRLSKKDFQLGAANPFFLYFPVEINVYIFVPQRFRDLLRYPENRKIRVSFLCKEGKHDSGNYLVKYKKGPKV